GPRPLKDSSCESGTDRLLAAPIWSRGSLVGVIDMRDKAQKQPFEQVDLPKAQGIADRMAAMFGSMNIFGQRFISIANAIAAGESVQPQREGSFPSVMQRAPAPAASAPAPSFVVPPSWPVGAAPALPTVTGAAPASVASPPPPRRPTPPPTHIPRLATLVHEAREAAATIAMPPQPPGITESELGVARDVLSLVLLIPGAMVAMFSAFALGDGQQEIMSRGPLTEDASAFLQAKLGVWLSKRGESGVVTSSHVSSLPGSSAPVAVDRVQKVFTAPIVSGSVRGLYLTVAFSGTPDRAAHELLAALHGQLQVALEHTAQREALRSLREKAAEALLEPAFSSYPDLRSHTLAVVAGCEEFGRFLALGIAEMDTLRLAAITHDVGMRVLDYDRLYRKKDLSADELQILREHVSVGAAMVAPLLGHEVARAVLSHHERFDGRGYPGELQGDEIPFEARILQICDAWVAMTDPHSYQLALGKDAALASINHNAGTQFDPELVRRFIDSRK
ncbi:MAG: HD domain-containing phosphohydrolase, partial [Acidobacteriota bacterium]